MEQLRLVGLLESYGFKIATIEYTPPRHSVSVYVTGDEHHLGGRAVISGTYDEIVLFVRRIREEAPATVRDE